MRSHAYDCMKPRLTGSGLEDQDH